MCRIAVPNTLPKTLADIHSHQNSGMKIHLNEKSAALAPISRICINFKDMEVAIRVGVARQLSR